jgi:3-oxoacyl-[acyl-carrier protein] reductase
VLHGHSATGALEDWVAEQDWSARALVLSADITDPDAVDRLVSAGRERFGRLDVCLANAGVWPPKDERLHELSKERVRSTIEVDLLGALWTARAFMAGLATDGPRADGHGACLLFTGSTAARFGEAGHADYAAAKAGLVGLMRSLKNEITTLDPWARVNVIEPGWTVTEMTARAVADPAAAARVARTMPLRQLGRAADIARCAAVLASPHASRHVSGQVLTVAGGMEGRVLWEDDQLDGASVVARSSDGG